MEVESSNEQMKAIEYHESDQIDDMEGVEFPSIDNISDMENVLIHFQLNEEDVCYTNFIKAQELYTEMFNDPYIERLQNGQYWSIEIDKLNCDYLPTNFKTRMHEFRQWTYNKKREELNKKEIEHSQTYSGDGNSQTSNEIKNKEQRKIEYQTEEFQKEIDVVIFPDIDSIDKMDTILSTDYESLKDENQCLELFGYGSTDRKRKRSEEDSTKDENLKVKQRKLNRDPRKASKKIPIYIVIKQGYKVNDLDTDIDNIIGEYKKTMDSSKDYSKQFE
ncbi:5787_t:CDS:2, partial [Paraglomus occultum]